MSFHCEEEIKNFFLLNQKTLYLNKFFNKSKKRFLKN